MLGVDARTFRVVWTIFLFGLLMLTIWVIRETLILLAVSIFVAYMLVPLVNLVQRLFPKGRTLPLTLVYVGLVALLATVGVNLVSEILDQASNFSTRLPQMVQHGGLASFPLPAWLEPMRARIIEAAQREAAELQASIVPLLQRAGGQIISGINFVVLVVLVPIVSFFLLKDAKEINRLVIATLGEAGDQRLSRRIVNDIHLVLSNYIRALALLACATFIAWLVFLYLTNAPYQLLLAGISGALEFIPGVGPAVSLVVVLIVCTVSGYGAATIWILVFWACLRLFQDYVLNPLLMSSGVQLHPLLVLLGVLAGGHIGGIPGLFFSVPVIAILKAVVVRMREAQTASKPPAPPFIPESGAVPSLVTKTDN